MCLTEGVGCWGINDIPNEKSREMKRIWISKYVDKRVEVWPKTKNMGSLCYNILLNKVIFDHFYAWGPTFRMK